MGHEFFTKLSRGWQDIGRAHLLRKIVLLQSLNNTPEERQLAELITDLAATVNVPECMKRLHRFLLHYEALFGVLPLMIPEKEK